MIRNYFKIAWRNLWKHKGYSFLNIFGLAIGITCASLIFLWVEDERNYDSFPKKELVYYVPTNQQYDAEWRTFYSTPGPLAADIKNDIPGVVRATRTSSESYLLSVDEEGINIQGRYADADVFDIFSLSFIEGNAADAFKKNEAIVITRKTALQLFGKDTDILGRIIKMEAKDNYIVTGVIENLPENVSFDFNWLAPFERYSAGLGWMHEYGSNFADTFVELSPEANFQAVDAKVRQIIQEKSDGSFTYAFLHSMNDWHLRSNFENGKIIGGSIVYVRLFTLIAFIILLIACINFMNLSTARSEKRANEVGVRKALGSGKKELISQFIAEAFITATIATIVSIGLLLVLLPQFNILIEKHLELGLAEPSHILALLSITVICGFFAGLYPAFYLSSFKPVDVLKGVRTKQGSAPFIRKGLVVIQFTVSIVFIISTIIVYQQVQHVKNRDLGYNKENLITMPVNGDMIKNFEPIKQDMIATGAIENVALNSFETLSIGSNGSGLEWQGGTNTEDVLISFRYISSGFIETSGMEIIEGRDFSDNKVKDSTNVLITQSFAKLMGEGSAIGKTIIRDKPYMVIGVVKDYLYGDMYGSSDPVMFLSYSNYARYMYIRTKPGISLNATLQNMEGIMKRYNPAFPFKYEFVDDAFNAKFKSEKLIESLSQIFALLAIIISCLGLFGLATYTTEQRRKEIGVRKVLGANVSGIVKLLSKDFLKLVLIAVVLAIPLAWWGMTSWLQDYAYRIDISWWAFAIAGIAAIFIALITVSFQAIKAAMANPVKSLRTE